MEDFEVRVLRQGCVMSPWTFYFFYDRVVKRMNKRVKGKGRNLRDGSERGWEMKQILYADNIGLVVKSRENLQQIANKFESTFVRMNLNIYVVRVKYW